METDYYFIYFQQREERYIGVNDRGQSEYQEVWIPRSGIINTHPLIWYSENNEGIILINWREIPDQEMQAIESSLDSSIML